MKKKIFDQSLIRSTKQTGLFVRMNPKSGAFTFSADLAVKLNINRTGAGVLIIQDEDRPQDWYIEASDTPIAFRTRQKPKTEGCVIQSTLLVRAILGSCGLEMDKSHRFLVSPEAVENTLYAIITKSAQSTLRKAS